MVVRRLESGRVRVLGKSAAAVITDLVAVDDDAVVLRALTRSALAIAGELRTVAAFTITTNPAIAEPWLRLASCRRPFHSSGAC